MIVTHAPTRASVRQAAAPAPEPPGLVAFHHYAHELLDLTGAVLAEYTDEHPDRLTIAFDNEQMVHLAKAAFRDSVDGATLVFENASNGEPLPPPPANGRTPWYDQPGNAVRFSQSLPGLVALWHDDPSSAVMFADTTDVAAHYAALLRPQIGPWPVKIVVGDRNSHPNAGGAKSTGFEGAVRTAHGWTLANPTR